MSHAYLSPSSAHRVFNCPASLRRSEVVEKRAELLKQIGPEFYGLDEGQAETFRASFEEDNEASSDGTALHQVFEQVMLLKTDDAPKIRQIIQNSNVSDEMKDDLFVIDRMIEICLHYLNHCNREGVKYSVEKRVRVKGLPQFGTVDLAVRDGRSLGVHDLKTGRNEVNAENNYQMLCYAVGLLDEYGWDNFDEVTLEIIGVRFTNSRAVMSVDDVRKFKVDVMLPAFYDAYSIQPSVNVGKWCQYCSAKLYCSKWLEQNDKAFDNVFLDDMTEKSNEELETLYYSFKELEQLVKGQVTQELLSRFDTFNEPTGVTRVKGGSVVKWSVSEEEVEKALDKFIKPDRLYKRSLLTPKQVEKLLKEEELDVSLSDDLLSYSVKKPYIKKL